MTPRRRTVTRTDTLIDYRTLSTTNLNLLAVHGKTFSIRAAASAELKRRREQATKGQGR